MSTERPDAPAVRHTDASAGVAGSPGGSSPAEGTSGESRSALFEEEIGRTNRRGKAIARHPVCAYIAARFGPLPFVMLLALLFEFARRNTGSYAVICWISFAFFTLVIVEPYLTHHVWARRTKLRREVVDGWRQGEVRAHEEAERLRGARDGSG